MKPILLKVIARCSSLLLLLLLMNTVHAQNGKGILLKRTLDGSKGQLVADSSVTLKDSVYFDPVTKVKLESTYFLRNIITFRINEYSTLYLGAPFTASANVRIYYLKPDGTEDSSTVTLTLNYDTAHTYTQRNSFVFNNAHQVTVKILGITTNAGKDIRAALVLDNEMEIRPVYKLSCTADVITTINYQAPVNGDQADELPVSWPAVVGADAYDLEWAYLDSSAIEARNWVTPDANSIFANNTTRVTIAGTNYTIPLLYDKVGVLYFRVRAVQEKPDDIRVETDWSSKFSTGLGQYSFNGHQRNLNWQSSISFAEDGKRKVVTQYFDGSLRNRQTVTKDNVTQNIVVAESFYDYQGRPVIQVLPAPTLDKVMKYTPGLNLPLNGAEYDKDRYDYIANDGELVNASAQRMDTSSGVNKYYSPANPDAGKGISQYIPDAEGYGFTETEYTPDNTGRISRQSGVGPTYRLGSKHETKFYYNRPVQSELDALFGTEVGLASHYFKNAVSDANGQLSVTYLDMHGRTIATALTGETENKNLTDLPTKKALVVTDSLSGVDNNIITERSIQSMYPLLIDADSSLCSFNYLLSPPVLQKKGCDSAITYYTGLYDLRIRITDNVRNQSLGGQPVEVVFRNYDPAAITAGQRPVVPDTIKVSFSRMLYKGVYNITKTLEISKQAMDYYRDSIFLPSAVCTTVDKLIEQQLEEQQKKDCKPSCIGCDSLHTDGDDIEVAMLQDMTPPSGQYADLSKSDEQYSIFRGSDGSRGTYAQPDIRYYNESGVIDSVMNPVTRKNGIPQDLSPAQFSDVFKSTWARTLLPYHPEYKKWQRYQDQFKDEQLWGKDFEATATYYAAKQKGYLDPIGTNSRFAGSGKHDPLMAKNFNALNEALTHYRTGSYSLWVAATLSVKCPDMSGGCVGLNQSEAAAFNESAMCGGDLDMAWRSFRTLYLQIRNDVINDLLDASSDVKAFALLAQGKMPHFSSVKDMANHVQLGDPGTTDPNDTASASQVAKTMLAKMYDDNCRAYVKVWMQQLAPCNYDTTALREITDSLLIVCKGGADMAHPYGSRTMKNPVPGVPGNFEEVIAGYNARHLPLRNPYVCNAELLTDPAAYGKQAAVSHSGSFTRPDDCQCDKLKSLRNEYNLKKEPADIDLSTYLRRTRGVKIPQSDLNALIDACTNATPDCNYLQKPINIPALLDCNAAPACVPCHVTDSLYAAYLVTYPQSAPALSLENDSVQLAKNRLFAAYMNNRLGYHYLASDYLKFRDSCSKGPAHTGRTICEPGSADSKRMINMYSNGGTDVILDVRTTADDGYILAGYTTGCSNGGKDGYIIRTNNKGDLLWAKTYGSTGDDTFSRLTPTQDGGYIAIGSTNSYCYDQGAILIVKMDGSGSVVWNRVVDFGQGHGGSGNDIIATSEGGYAFGGLRTTAGINTDWIGGRLTASGDLIWLRQGGTSANRDVIRLLETNDTLVYASSIMDGTNFDVTLIKVRKETGDGFAGLQYDLEGRDNICNSIVKTATGYRLVIGNRKNAANPTTNGALLDVSTDGTIVAAKKMLNPASFDSQTANVSFVAARTSDGGMIASQSTKDTYWYKLDAGGVPKWGSRVNIAATEWVTCLVQNSAGGYAGAGVNSNHAMLMLADAQGKTGCTDQPETLGAVDVTSAFTKKNLGMMTDVVLGTNNVSTVALVERVCTPSFSTETCPGIDSCYELLEGPLLCGNTEPTFPDIEVPPITNCSDSSRYADAKGRELFNVYRDSLINDFDRSYISRALSAVYGERFAVQHASYEHHYTLYYYDQAGNLVKTIPPAGVVKDATPEWANRVAAARAAGQSLVPAHTMATNYRYNTLNQVVAQYSPDGNLSHFWYDRLGRLAVSQNRKQALVNAYSYTLYDYLGRITEVGEISSSAAMTPEICKDATQLSQWLTAAGGSRSQITRTIYDQPNTFLEQDIWQAKNLRNRVSWSAVYNNIADTIPGGQASATYYSYDIHGNVRTLLQDYSASTPNPGNRFKKIEYNYDLISGKVNSVSYQPGQRDAFYHRYSYDAENRITNVETSRDSIYWENDVYYQYYKHGPLARSVIGQQQVQGLDYAYSLQGWLKGVNSTTATSAFDIGKDGAKGGITAQDAFGFALHYFGDNDYKPINSTVQPFASAGVGLKSLYNGNISAMSVNIPKVGTPLRYSYTYDALNRLVAMDVAHNLNVNTNTWTPISVGDFGEKISYDPNGNILSYDRHGNSTWAGKSLQMDSMKYHYQPGKNQLLSISDDVDPLAYNNDIDGQGNNNYVYDSIGNLVKDVKEGIDIEWTVYGKIKQIKKADNSTIVYTYDVAGNRISKVAKGIETRYIRDASGNVMSVYVSGDQSINSGLLSQTETHLYGSSRLGINNMSTQVQNDETPELIRLNGLGFGTFTTFVRGNKFFELSNHLGNVLATVTDAKKAVSMDGNVVDHYEAEVASAQDYAPFGMGLQGRGFDAGRYRYGFNGKENDNEIKGEGNQYDYGFRIYNPQIGRFLSTDPLAKKFAFYTPYQFSGNKPTVAVDLDGQEDHIYTISFFNKQGQAVFTSSHNEGQVVGMDRNGYEVYDRPEKFVAAYNIAFIDGTSYSLMQSFDSYKEMQGVKQSAFYSQAVSLSLWKGVDLGAKSYYGSEAGYAVYGLSKVALSKYAARAVASTAAKAAVDNTAVKKYAPELVRRSYNGDDVFMDYDGWELGWYTKKPNGGVSIELLIQEPARGIGLGTMVFNEAVKDATRFEGLWVESDIYGAKGMSDNLIQYNKAIADGLSPEKAAFSTWSGNLAKKAGFNHVKVTPLTGEVKGVSAVFTK
ncbi:MAG: hypothetical protein J7623_15945 [Chitinophaga sp.]|uniref:RHS repeat domain-containing protein n=1 Tax=Chitinophaga sp. TaxID=1869181 RepID=UPI001B17C04E|nr:RHS repeat-associated core domain-containing protein [Chitinophaga sp.]MBO9730131.1 hypothetical protein [Chitinophaga sp.]